MDWKGEAVFAFRILSVYTVISGFELLINELKTK